MIKRWRTRNPNLGFNLSPGGSHVPHPIRRNPWDNHEYRAKASLAAKERWQNPKIRAANIAAVKITLNTPESRAKRSLISKINLNKPEVKAKISLASKGKKRNLTNEQRRKLSEHGLSVIKANPHLIEQLDCYRASNQPEVRTKISESMKRFMQNEEVRAKISVRNTGRKFSKEDRSKISARLTGKKLSPEHRANISLSQKGRVLSIEHKTKISESCKKARQSQAHCKRGHLLNDAYIKKDDRRSCRHCHKLERVNRRASSRASRARP